MVVLPCQRTSGDYRHEREGGYGLIGTAPDALVFTRSDGTPITTTYARAA